MNITILCVGKIKEKYLADGIAEYSKRLGRYCKLKTVEAADEKTPENASEAEEQQIKLTEAKRLLNHINDDALVIALAIEGDQYDSVAFSSMLERAAVNGKSNIQFIIGGSLGLHESILNRADLLLSFSKMTFPHQLMRLMFLEQLYRAFRIWKGEPYHK